MKSEKVKALLDGVIAELRAVPTRLSGEDSPLADVWEEIKEQVQHELSFYWPSYLDAMNRFIEHQLANLAAAELLLVCEGLKTPADNTSRVKQALLFRLLARARREKVRYAPFDFEYCWYLSSLSFCIYMHIIERTGTHKCRILAYSVAALSGEQGEIDLAEIDRSTDINIMTADDFEKARGLRWPERWK